MSQKHESQVSDKLDFTNFKVLSVSFNQLEKVFVLILKFAVLHILLVLLFIDQFVVVVQTLLDRMKFMDFIFTFLVLLLIFNVSELVVNYIFRQAKNP